MTVAESESNFRITTDTPYLALTGQLGKSFVRILEKADRVITAPHCILNPSLQRNQASPTRPSSPRSCPRQPRWHGNHLPTTAEQKSPTTSWSIVSRATSHGSRLTTRRSRNSIMAFPVCDLARSMSSVSQLRTRREWDRPATPLLLQRPRNISVSVKGHLW